MKKMIDIIDIINYGGFLNLLKDEDLKNIFAKEDIVGGKSFVYIGYVGEYVVEVGELYEQIYKSSIKNNDNIINILDHFMIMDLTYSDAIQIKNLPSFEIYTIDSIGQINLQFSTGVTLIYEDMGSKPALLGSKRDGRLLWCNN